MKPTRSSEFCLERSLSRFPLSAWNIFQLFDLNQSFLSIRAMPPSPQRSPRDSSRSPRSESSKFIPNMAQLQQAIKDLPDPELWSEMTCVISILIEKKQKLLEFTRKRINRGEHRPYRWVYEGRVLIRKRDS